MIIRKLRLQRGWSQEHLAELTGLSVRTIQRLERGANPSLESRAALAAVFEVDPATFDPATRTDEKQEEVMSEETIQPKIETVSKDEQEALEFVKGIREFYTHVVLFVTFSVIFIFTGKITDLYIVWAGWAIGLIVHGLVAYEIIGPFLSINWEKKMVEKRLKRKL